MECFSMKHENLNRSSQFCAELIITQNTKLGKMMLNAKLGTALHQKSSLRFFKPPVNLALEQSHIKDSKSAGHC